MQRTRPVHVAYIVVALFLQFTVLSLNRPVLPKVLDNTYGSDSYRFNGYAEGTKGFLSFLSAPAFGTMSDSYGRRLPLLINVAGTSAPFVLLAITNSPSVYLVSLGASGAFAGVFPIAFAMVADIVGDDSPSRKTTSFGFMQASLGLSFAIGPVCGSWLYESYGQQRVFSTAATVAIVNLVYIWLFVPETLKTNQIPGTFDIISKETQWQRLNPCRAMSVLNTSKRMKRLALIASLHALALWCKIATLLLYLRNHFAATEQQLGTFMSGLGTCFLLSEAFVLPLLTSCGVTGWVLVCGGLGAFVIQLLQIGFATSAHVVFMSAFWAISMGVVTPALGSLVSQEATCEVQGKAQGAIGGLRSLMEGFAPFIFGNLMEVFAPTRLPGACYLIAAGLVAVALLIALIESGACDGCTEDSYLDTVHPLVGTEHADNKPMVRQPGVSSYDSDSDLSETECGIDDFIDENPIEETSEIDNLLS